jgi:hypothetical protein
MNVDVDESNTNSVLEVEVVQVASPAVAALESKSTGEKGVAIPSVPSATPSIKPSVIATTNSSIQSAAVRSTKRVHGKPKRWSSESASIYAAHSSKYYAAVGTVVSKIFLDDYGNERPFYGNIVGYDADSKLYKVRYDDGDGEEMNEFEVTLLIANLGKKRGLGTSSPRKKKGASANDGADEGVAKVKSDGEQKVTSVAKKPRVEIGSGGVNDDLASKLGVMIKSNDAITPRKKKAWDDEDFELFGKMMKKKRVNASKDSIAPKRNSSSHSHYKRCNHKLVTEANPSADNHQIVSTVVSWAPVKYLSFHLPHIHLFLRAFFFHNTVR